MNQIVTAALRRGNKKACGLALGTALAIAPVLSHAGLTYVSDTETADAFSITYAFSATAALPDLESWIGTYWQSEITTTWNGGSSFTFDWTGHHDGTPPTGSGVCNFDSSSSDGTYCVGSDVAFHAPDGVDEYNFQLDWAGGGGTVTLTGNHYPESVSAVPVPATAWLFGSGIAGLAAFARRRKPGR